MQFVSPSFVDRLLSVSRNALIQVELALPAVVRNCNRALTFTNVLSTSRGFPGVNSRHLSVIAAESGVQGKAEFSLDVGAVWCDL